MHPRERTRIFAESYSSPLGRLWFASDEVGIVCLEMPSPAAKALLLERVSRRYGDARIEGRGEINDRFLIELEGYFSGALRAFRSPVNPAGTPFQQRVWRLVSKIPYGKTRSYGDLARELGIPKGPRAVGHANGRNPVPLLIPCHRVIAGDGALRGYCAGIEKKRSLLEWKRRALLTAC